MRILSHGEVNSQLNNRIFPVLLVTTGQQLGAEPVAWWNWWQRYNENYTGKTKPVYAYKYTDARYHDFTPAPIVSHSCFPRGTMVWSETGRRPIESIEIGDCVLAQDPDTGEMAYKVVLDTTVRPASPVMRLVLGTEELSMTLGHPLWAVGKGWQMSKQLSLGDALHTLHGSAVIDRIEKVDEQEAFNLVVADFNTYFVGKSGVLAHDNTPRRPTRVLVPGLLPEEPN